MCEGASVNSTDNSNRVSVQLLQCEQQDQQPQTHGMTQRKTTKLQFQITTMSMYVELNSMDSVPALTNILHK